MYHYQPQGVCSDGIDVELDGDTIEYVKFSGGCDGNLNAISKLVVGLSIDQVAQMLEGNTCHRHSTTSCADQMVKALRTARETSIEGGTCET